ncbi:hypothetical protein [Lunatibacter salilacus]|uniref:hypothetical protein n=1 Tax=Lunatibacter salilacus TaxID=2483804 RepID=UPI00131D3F10|nr:hypothetical protein [Lunatibacter salilacus]
MIFLTKLIFRLKTIILFGTLFLGIFYFGHAQEFVPKVPTPVEFMAGNNRLFFQMVVKKKFTPQSKFGFLSVATFSSSYNNQKEDLDQVMPVLVNYNFYKGFGLVAGTTVNNVVGFSPVVGAQHSVANREWVAVTIATFFLSSSKNAELFGIYEYKPKVSPKTNLYTRFQFMYVHGIQQNHHARSFLQLRSGLKLNDLSFGLGANLDQYGPEKTFKPNYGLFVGWVFQ